jgi:hypothetical protein
LADPIGKWRDQVVAACAVGGPDLLESDVERAGERREGVLWHVGDAALGLPVVPRFFGFAGSTVVP